jgi:hypothetical protein
MIWGTPIEIHTLPFIPGKSPISFEWDSVVVGTPSPRDFLLPYQIPKGMPNSRAVSMAPWPSP